MNLPAWILWQLATLPPLALLYLLWRLALRGERCYAYNRALLLLAPVLATTLPLLPHPMLPAWLVGGTAGAGLVAAVLLPELPIGATAPHAAAMVAGWPWLLRLYLAGVAVGLGRLGWQLLRLHCRLARRLPRLEYEDYALVHTGGQLPTSTFGRVVFWDETAGLAPAEAQAVLAHELAHVRQRHTRDVLWLELWRIVLWPNPFAHLLPPALRLTHELLADAEAAAATPGEPYAPLLARLAARRLAGPVGLSLLQPFALSSTLTRITMLKNQVPVRRWKQWLVLPVLGGLLLAACQTAPAPEQAAAPPAPPMPMTTSQEVDAFDKNKIYTFVEHMPHLPSGGGQRAIVEAIQAKVVYPPGTPDGRVFANFTVATDGRVQNINIVKGLTPAADEAVIQAIKQLPVFVPGKQGDNAATVSFTVPVLFQAKP